MPIDNMPPDLAARYDALKRREKLRQALMEQTLTPTQTQYTGGPYSRAVPYSPIQGGLKMIQAALLNKRGKNINKDLRQLGEEYSQGGQDEVSRVMAQAYGGDAPYKMSPDETFAGETIPGLQTTYEADPRKAALMGAGSEYPSAQRVSDAILDMQSNQSRRGGYFKEVDVVLNGIPTKVLLNARTGQITDLFGKPVAMTPELEGQITPTLQGSQISQGPYGPTVLPSYSMPVDPKYSKDVTRDLSQAKQSGTQSAKAGEGGAPSEAYLEARKQDTMDTAAMRNPDSPEYIAQKDQYSKDMKAIETQSTIRENNISKIDEILSEDNKEGFEYNFGGYNAYMSQYAPNDQAAKIQKLVDSLKAALKTEGKAALTADGTTIGQITEREWPILEQQLANLDRRLGEPDARELLKEIRRTLERVGRVGRESYESRWKGTQFYKPLDEAPDSGVVPPPDADVQDLVDHYTKQ